jgi:hypothetical protein
MDTQERSLEAASHLSADLNNSPNELSANGPRRIAMDTVMDSQHGINDGQRNINGALCYVDWHVIEAFKALRDALAYSNVLSQQALDQINKPFNKAYYTSERVAEIIPPGCGSNFPKPTP